MGLSSAETGREIKQVIKDSVVKCQKETDIGSMRKQRTRKTSSNRDARGGCREVPRKLRSQRAGNGTEPALLSKQPVRTPEATKEHRLCGDRRPGWAAGGELGEVAQR